MAAPRRQPARKLFQKSSQGVFSSPAKRSWARSASRAVEAEDLDGAAGEGGAEGEIDLGRGALAAGGDQEALVERPSGRQLAGLEERRGGRQDRPRQRVHLAHRVRPLLEEDVLRGAEHPVREVAGGELGERHREAELDVLDTADPPRAHLAQQAREGGVEDLLWLTPSGRPRWAASRPSSRTAFESSAAGFSSSTPIPSSRSCRVTATWWSGGVRTWAISTSSAGSSSTEVTAWGTPHWARVGGAVAVEVGDRHHLDAGERLEDLQMEAGDVAGTHQGDTQRRARPRGRCGGAGSGHRAGAGVRDGRQDGCQDVRGSRRHFVDGLVHVLPCGRSAARAFRGNRPRR